MSNQFDDYDYHHKLFDDHVADVRKQEEEMLATGCTCFLIPSMVNAGTNSVSYEARHIVNDLCPIHGTEHGEVNDG